jgi:hypothetical protein
MEAMAQTDNIGHQHAATSIHVSWRRLTPVNVPHSRRLPQDLTRLCILLPRRRVCGAVPLGVDGVDSLGLFLCHAHRGVRQNNREWLPSAKWYKRHLMPRKPAAPQFLIPIVPPAFPTHGCREPPRVPRSRERGDPRRLQNMRGPQLVLGASPTGLKRIVGNGHDWHV